MGTLPLRYGAERGQTWRGTRTITWRVTLYRHRDPASLSHDLTPFCSNVRTHKALGEPAGAWSMTLKSQVLAHAGRIASGPNDRRELDWRDEIDDDDWIRIDVHDGRRWTLWYGMVDSVRRQVSPGERGARIVSFSVAGRDFAKPLVENELVDLPFAPYDPVMAQGSFYDAVNALASMPEGATPGVVVGALFEYLMRGGGYRVPRRRTWALPPSLPLRTQYGPRDANDRQFSDMLVLALDTELEGAFSPLSILSMANQQSRTWDLLSACSNKILNEMYVDLVPTQTIDPAIMADYFRALGEAYEVEPTLVLREKPFPAHPETTPDRPFSRMPSEHWQALPETAIHELDFELDDMGRSHTDRFNYFLLESGGNALIAKYILALASAHAGGEDGFWGGMPAVDLASVEIHGWRKMEQSSTFIDVNAESFDPYVAWTRLLRDWYALGHRYLNGRVRVVYALPGVHIGERLRIVRREGEEHAYIEAVDHDLSVGSNGVQRGRTTLSLTRGVRGSMVQLPDVRSGVRGPGDATLAVLPADRIAP